MWCLNIEIQLFYASERIYDCWMHHQQQYWLLVDQSIPTFWWLATQCRSGILMAPLININISTCVIDIINTLSRKVCQWIITFKENSMDQQSKHVRGNFVVIQPLFYTLFSQLYKSLIKASFTIIYKSCHFTGWFVKYKVFSDFHFIKY